MENRLNLLCDAGVIDKDICIGMQRVVKKLDEEWHLPVHTEQGMMAITHMASALMRSRRGEVIEALNGELLDEMAQSHLWPTIKLVHLELLQAFTVTLHTNEEGYLLANLYGLWMATEDGV